VNNCLHTSPAYLYLPVSAHPLPSVWLPVSQPFSSYLCLHASVCIPACPSICLPLPHLACMPSGFPACLPLLLPASVPLPARLPLARMILPTSTHTGVLDCLPFSASASLFLRGYLNTSAPDCLSSCVSANLPLPACLFSYICIPDDGMV
jgi:hypothetical protein